MKKSTRILAVLLVVILAVTSLVFAVSAERIEYGAGGVSQYDGTKDGGGVDKGSGKNDNTISFGGTNLSNKIAASEYAAGKVYGISFDFMYDDANSATVSVRLRPGSGDGGNRPGYLNITATGSVSFAVPSKASDPHIMDSSVAGQTIGTMANGWNHFDIAVSQTHTKADDGTISYTVAISVWLNGVQIADKAPINMANAKINQHWLLYTCTYDAATETYTYAEPPQGGVRMQGYTSEAKTRFLWVKNHCAWTGEMSEATSVTPLTINVDGGTFAKVQTVVGKIEKTYGMVDVPNYFRPGDVVTLPTPTKANHEFKGWALKEGTPATVTLNESVLTIAAEHTGAVEVVAQWERTAYDVAYEMNGGAFASYEKLATIATTEATVKITETPTLQNHEFAGWFTNAELTGTAYQTNEDIPITAVDGVVTFYAGWTRTGGDVIFQANGATIAGETPSSFSVTTPGAITLPEATVSGGTFLGWYLTPDFSGEKLGATYEITQEMLDGGLVSVTFYAKTAVTFLGLNFDDGVTTGLTLGNKYVDPETLQNVSGGEPVNVYSTEGGVLSIAKNYGNPNGWTTDPTVNFDVSGKNGLESGVLVINFDVKRDAEKNVIKTGFRPRTGSTRPDIFFIHEDGRITVGEYTVGVLTTEFQTLSVVMTFVDDDIHVDAYLDNVLGCKDVVFADTGVTAANVQTFNIVFDRVSTGILIFDNFHFVDGEAIDADESTAASVTYQTFGGTVSEGAAVKYPYGTVTTIDATATREGYTFIGWFTDPECTVAFTGFTADAKEPTILYAGYEGIYAATYMINGTPTVVEKVCDITFPDTAEYWIDAAGTVYKPGDALTLTANTTFYAITVELLDGASIRLGDPTGLRFETEVDTAILDALVAGGYTYRVGTLVVPADKLGATAFNAAAMTEAGISFMELSSDFSTATDKSRYFATIAEVLGANYLRSFSAVSYIEFTKDGETIRVYDAFDAEKNTRSIYQVAVMAFVNPDASFTPDNIATIRGFIDRVVLLHKDGTLVEIPGYTPPYTVTFPGAETPTDYSATVDFGEDADVTNKPSTTNGDGYEIVADPTDPLNSVLHFTHTRTGNAAGANVGAQINTAANDVAVKTFSFDIYIPSRGEGEKLNKYSEFFTTTGNAVMYQIRVFDSAAFFMLNCYAVCGESFANNNLNATVTGFYLAATTSTSNTDVDHYKDHIFNLDTWYTVTLTCNFGEVKTCEIAVNDTVLGETDNFFADSNYKPTSAYSIRFYAQMRTRGSVYLDNFTYSEELELADGANINIAIDPASSVKAADIASVVIGDKLFTGGWVVADEKTATAIYKK